MKTKKVVVGTMAAAVFSLSLMALPAAFAAGETVQISVGSQEVAPGEEFSVDVMLKDIPSPGIQACDFSITYDTKLIEVTSVTAGALTKTGAESADSTAAMVPNFESYIISSEGKVNVAWSTALDDSKYWLQSSGVICTITGKASASAANGSKADLKVAAVKRDTYPDSGNANALITAGYTKDNKAVRYEVSKIDGVISIGVPVVSTTTATTTTVTTTTTQGTTTTVSEEKPTTTTTITAQPTTNGGDVDPSKRLFGDANCDKIVNISDAVAVMSYVSNPTTYPLSAQGMDNADVYGRGDGVSNMDALSIQKFMAQVLTELPESFSE